MKSSIHKAILFTVGCSIGILIIFSPTIISGQSFSNQDIGNFLSVNLVLRTSALIAGLLVIYDSAKNCFMKS